MNILASSGSFSISNSYSLFCDWSLFWVEFEYGLKFENMLERVKNLSGEKMHTYSKYLIAITIKDADGPLNLINT